jgi:signal transduction histidine kinase
VRDWLIVLGIALAYAGTGQLSLWTAQERVGGWPTLWLPSAVGLGAVTVMGSRAAIGVGLGALLLRAAGGADLFLALSSVFGNTIEALAGGWILRRRFGLPSRPVPSSETTKLVLTLALITNLSAVIGISIQMAVGRMRADDLFLNWWSWWAGNAGAVITLLPLFFIAQTQTFPSGQKPRGPVLTFSAGILLSSAIAFLGKANPSGAGFRLSLALLPVLVVKWASLTLGPFAVAAGGAVLSLICSFATNLGHGPFASEDPMASFNACCTFLLLTGTLTLWLSNLALERHATQLFMERANERLEQTVALRTRELEERGGELQSFSYAISHDLRAPLRGISGWIMALEEDCSDSLNEIGRVHLSRIRAEAERMGSLIEGLLRLARIGSAELKTSEVDLTAIAQRIVKRLQLSEPDRIRDVDVEEGMTTRGDPALLEIALTNLLENAWKFSAKAHLPSIHFHTGGGHGRDQFVLADNGVGFDPANQKRLFIPFQRFHKQSDFPGTGIGLSTVQRIIRRHGGEIRLESSPGLGTTVHFSLRASDKDAPPTPPLS